MEDNPVKRYVETVTANRLDHYVIIHDLDDNQPLVLLFDSVGQPYVARPAVLNRNEVSVELRPGTWKIEIIAQAPNAGV